MKSKKEILKKSKTSAMSLLSRPSRMSYPENHENLLSYAGSMLRIAMSDEHLEDSGDSGILLEHDVGIVYLPEAMQTLLNCVVGETLGVDNRWMKVPSELILAEVWEKENRSLFASYKEAVKNYSLSHMWVGFDPSRDQEDEYLICTTERGYNSLEQEMVAEERRLYEAAEKKVEPRTWKSYGSEKDIEETKLYSTRQQMGMSLTLDACTRLNQPREPLANVEPPVVELRPSAKEVFDLVEKTLFDVAVQAVPRTLAAEVQTRRAFTRNAAMQSVDNVTILKDLDDVTAGQMRQTEKDEDPRSQTRRVERFRDRLAVKADMVLEAVQEEAVVNLFDSTATVDPLLTTVDTQDTKDPGTEEDRFQEVEVFAEVSYVRGKQISSVAWHPNYSGLVAVAYVNNRGTDCSGGASPTASSTDILGGSETSLTSEDSDTESMILPPIEKQKAPPPPASLGEEPVEDETLAAVEKKKLRRSSDVKVWRDRTAPPLPFLQLDLAKYDTETFDYEVYPEDEAMDWTRIIRQKLVVLDEVTSNEKLNVDEMSGEKVHVIDQEQYERMREKAEKVEEMKGKAEEAFGGGGDNERKHCVRNDMMRRIEEAAMQSPGVSPVRQRGQGDAKRKASYKVLEKLWKYNRKHWPFGSALLKDLRTIYALPEEKDEDIKPEDLQQEIPKEVLPSNLRDLKQRRSPQKKALKKLGLSVHTSLSRRKPPSLFKAALDKNPKLKQTYASVQTKAKALGLPGPDSEVQKPSLMPKVGKVVQEDPNRDPCLGAENSVLLWSVCDSLMPLLVLDSPHEVNSLQFAPHDGNILAGGLSSGLIVIWDLTGRIEKAMGEDLSANLNSVRRKLESLLGWTKALSSDRVVRASVLSERENSHELPVMHVQWIHPLIQVTSTGEFSVKDPRTHPTGLSYQLVSCSLYGRLKFWDLKAEGSDLMNQEEDCPIRAYAEKILARTGSELDKLDRVWKPFYTISPMQPAPPEKSTGSSFAIHQEMPTFVLSKFNLQQPRVKYRKRYSSADEESRDEELPRYQFVGEKISSSDFPRTALFASFSGMACLTSWASRQGSRDLDEDARLLWKQTYHDGPVTSLSSCHFESKATLTSGGHEWCIWHDDYELGPILWKRYDDVIPSAIWSPFRPGVFFVARMDGIIEVWDLLRSNSACVEEIVVCDDSLTELSCSPHVATSDSYLAVGDVAGNLRLFSVPEHHRHYTSEELAKFQSLCSTEPARRRATTAWTTQYAQGHPEPEAVFVALARLVEGERAAARDRDEASKMWKFDDPAKKWAAKKRELERGRNKVEEKLTQRFLEQQKNAFIEAAIRKKNIDKCNMELLRKPLLKKETAAIQVQERISRKLKSQQQEVEDVTMRKFPLIKDIITKPACPLTPPGSALSLPPISTSELLPSLCPSGFEESSDLPGFDLRRLTSEEQVGEFLQGVDTVAQEMEEEHPRWADMMETYDGLRRWLNPLKPYVDVEQWRRLRKQYELAQKQKSDSLQSLQSDLTGTSPDRRSGEALEADVMSKASLTSLQTATRTVIEDLSLLTFSQASGSGSSKLLSDYSQKQTSDFTLSGFSLQHSEVSETTMKLSETLSH